MTGAQTDRMTRDDAWRLLSIGRHIERLSFLSNALLGAGFENHAVHEVSGFEAMVALFDSTITFHARYQQRRDVATLVDLLVLDAENPRSLAWVTQTLRGRIARLAGSAPGKLTALSYELPDPATWTLEHLCARPPAARTRPYAGAGRSCSRTARPRPTMCPTPSAPATSRSPPNRCAPWAPELAGADATDHPPSEANLQAGSLTTRPPPLHGPPPASLAGLALAGCGKQEPPRLRPDGGRPAASAPARRARAGGGHRRRLRALRIAERKGRGRGLRHRRA